MIASSLTAVKKQSHFLGYMQVTFHEWTAEINPSNLDEDLTE